MVLTARKRVSPIDVLQIDHEYCTISYYTNGIENELGEPARILAERATNVKCSIDAMVRSSYTAQGGNIRIAAQGRIMETTHYMIVTADQVIEPEDVVTDCDGTTYNVVHVVNWYTHKEAFLKHSK